LRVEHNQRLHRQLPPRDGSNTWRLPRSYRPVDINAASQGTVGNTTRRSDNNAYVNW
jgi:hypothetical protein